MSAVRAFTLGARIKRDLRNHLRELGFTKKSDGSLNPPNDDKETYRHLHRHHRDAKSAASARPIIERLSEFEKYFASGTDIDPERIDPELEEIDADGWQTKLFRAASLTWSVPVSNGYGRRMRFLVWDKQNTKLIGLIALGDPVFNMGARDRVIGWTSADREKRLVNMMDAYVLGAVPPYNQLLGGKLVASLVRTREIAERFKAKYGDTRGIISQERKRARLLCVTTTSSLGRSSIYNRLKLDGTEYFKSVGFTSGYGHFQIPSGLFEDILSYLKKRRRSYADGHQFGDGPNWRMRAVRLALELLEVNQEVLRHNLQREIFICKYASNAYACMCGHNKRPIFTDLLSVSEVSALAKARWMIPRALRRPEFLAWTKEETLQLIRRDGATVGEADGLQLEA